MQSLTPKTIKANFTQAALENALQPGQWLKLESVPSPFAYDEALLLCRVSQREWISWVPNYGEYILTL